MIEFIQNWLAKNNLSPGEANILANMIFIGIIIMLCYIIDLISKKIILNYLGKAVRKTKYTWDDILFQKKVFNRLSQIVPATLVYTVAPVFPTYESIIQRLSSAYIMLIGLLFIHAMLDAIVDIYGTFEISKKRPIKSYVQVVNIFAFILGGILIIATIIDRSPLLLLSGMGALMAIILIVFKDTLLGLVASIQLMNNNMVHLGDWVEIPNHGADGDVIDISLNTIKVQNWDKTITTVPTYALVSESFKNWRGMQESGGRRIKRVVNIDMTSIKFCDEEMIERFEGIQLISDYIRAKKQEVEQYNLERGYITTCKANGRRLTNIGTFRAYLQAYLKDNPKVNQNMTMLVRHLTPTEHGLPVEIYCFTSDCAWTNYESIQADIFDHILAVLPEFDLRVFQDPSGHDMRELMRGLKDEDEEQAEQGYLEAY